MYIKLYIKISNMYQENISILDFMILQNIILYENYIEIIIEVPHCNRDYIIDILDENHSQ
jgi:hypothetical protein